MQPIGSRGGSCFQLGTFDQVMDRHLTATIGRFWVVNLHNSPTITCDPHLESPDFVQPILIQLVRSKH